MLARTAPLEQWAVSRELRRRMVEAFKAEGIEIPPHIPLLAPGGEEGVRPPGT